MTDEDLNRWAEEEAIRMLSPVMTAVGEELWRRGFRDVRMTVELPPADPAVHMPAPAAE